MYDFIQNPPLPSSPQEQVYIIFLFGLSNTITRDELYNYFAQGYRSIINIRMKSKTKDGKITGYAFLYITSLAEYKDILSINRFYLHQRHFFAKPYLQGDELKKFKSQVKQRRVFVFGIPFSFQNEDLRCLMGQFGPLEDAFVVKDKTQGENSKGYGYATFYRREDANAAKNQGRIQLGNHLIKIVEFMKKEEQALNKARRGESTGSQPSQFLTQNQPLNYSMENYRSKNNDGGLVKELGNFGSWRETRNTYHHDQIATNSEENFSKKAQGGIERNLYVQMQLYAQEPEYSSDYQNSNQMGQVDASYRLPANFRRKRKKRRITRRNKDRVRVFTIGGIFIQGMNFNHTLDNIRMNKGNQLI